MTIFFDMVRKIFGKGCNQMKQSEKQHRFPIFCDRLCELQGKKTIAAFAAFLGLSRPTVNFYLNGDRVPDALTLRQIAERCNVSSDWLLGLSDVKDPDGTLQQVCRYTGLNAQSRGVTKTGGTAAVFRMTNTIRSSSLMNFSVSTPVERGKAVL